MTARACRDEPAWDMLISMASPPSPSETVFIFAKSRGRRPEEMLSNRLGGPTARAGVGPGHAGEGKQRAGGNHRRELPRRRLGEVEIDGGGPDPRAVGLARFEEHGPEAERCVDRIDRHRAGHVARQRLVRDPLDRDEQFAPAELPADAAAVQQLGTGGRQRELGCMDEWMWGKRIAGSWCRSRWCLPRQCGSRLRRPAPARSHPRRRRSPTQSRSWSDRSASSFPRDARIRGPGTTRPWRR